MKKDKILRFFKRLVTVEVLFIIGIIIYETITGSKINYELVALFITLIVVETFGIIKNLINKESKE